ncbi:MAG TPA: anti-sigma factor [Candidatus Acidoferrum sp.]|nr:anti-sigma factor [Candidatus Acidoferrum sp.]
MKTCDQFREMFEAYALGALEPEERAAIDAHLATGCAECAGAAEEARWLVSQLAYTAPGAMPSEMLRGRLLQTVRAEAKTSAGETPRTIPSRSSIPYWLWAAVAALLLFSIYSSWNMRRLQIEIRKDQERTAELLVARQKTEQQLGWAKREAMVMMDPSSHKIDLWGKDSHPEELEAKWHSELGLCVMGEHVEMPKANHVLQVWFIPKKAGAKPMPSVMARPDKDGRIVFMVTDPPEAMDAIKSIAITEEPAGGSPWPTSTPLWSGNVT